MNKVLFLHIHKCGGTSIRHMLNAVYPQPEQLPVPVKGEPMAHPYRTIQEYAAHYQSAAPQEAIDKAHLIMGHYDWRMAQRVGDDVTVLTMLRNPVDQLISQWLWFAQDKKAYGTLVDKFRYSGFEGFLNSPDVHRYANQQVRFLAGHFWGFHDVNTGHVMNAKRNIRTRALYGLVERWEDSITLFEKVIGVPLPREHRNPTRQAPPTLTDAMLEQIEQLQTHDISLYKYAVKHFEEQF